MPGIQFTQEDIISAAELPAGWYPVVAKSITEGAGKKDPTSTTWSCIFVITGGEFKGREVMHWFSSKMMKNAIRYMKCFGVQPKVGESYPIEETVDRPLEAYCIWDIDNINNVIKDFKPAGR